MAYKLKSTTAHKHNFDMKKIRIIVLILATCCLASCGIVFGVSEYGATKFSNDDIQLGDTKEAIIKKYGKPYSQELELVYGKTIETLGYKESMPYSYKINTYFIFEDGLLIKKIQNEEKPRPEIKVENKE